MPQSSPTLVSEMSISHHATGTDFQTVWLQFSHCLAAAKTLTAKFCFCVAMLSLLSRNFPFSLLSLSLCPTCPVCVWLSFLLSHSFVCILSAQYESTRSSYGAFYFSHQIQECAPLGQNITHTSSVLQYAMLHNETLCMRASAQVPQ